ncbi:MAG: LacI family DNA-binding transcriptional regulator [Phycisphaeraceae bacterium JB051]
MTQSQPISIYQLAQQLGVSTTTISRVLNGREGIGKATRQRVWDAARASGFRPRLAVRQRTVGVVQDFVPEHFMGLQVTNLNVGVDRALTEKSFSIETFGTHNIGSITDRYLDAVLAIAWENKTLEILKEISQTIPVVIFNRPEITAFSSVNMNCKQGGHLAAQHFWSKGHRRIGMLATKPSNEALDFSAGMKQYIESQGGSFHEDHVAYNFFRSSLAPLKRLLAQDITAIFLPNSELTYEVPYLSMEGLNLSIPGDLSLIGMDANPALQFYRPPMTVLCEPLNDMAMKGINLLQQSIDQPDRQPTQTMLDYQLIIRESVANPHS